MFSDFALVIDELFRIDPDAHFSLENNDNLEINIYSSNEDLFDPKNLSREAAVAMIRNGWRYDKDDEFHNYYLS